MYGMQIPRYTNQQRRPAPAAPQAAAEIAQAFDPATIELLKALSEIVTWNSFAASLVRQHRTGKVWSDKQVAAAKAMLAKIAATKEAKAKAQTEAPVDLGGLRTMIDTARASGLKRPTFRFGDVIISRAPDTGRNPGALYVKTSGGEYQGKVTGVTYAGNQTALPMLMEIAADPRGAAVRYGKLTGNCACCGRALTDPRSVAAGIGPICAERFGLDR